VAGDRTSEGLLDEKCLAEAARTGEFARIPALRWDVSSAALGAMAWTLN